MEKLKTLKELNVLRRSRTERTGQMHYQHTFPFRDIEICWTSQLKYEAMRWMKKGTYMKKPMSNETKEFIKHFFDLNDAVVSEEEQ